jgi:hypothetical protein
MAKNLTTGRDSMVDIDKLIQFEAGHMEHGEYIRLFADLIKDGTAWSLQGMYVRNAQNLIDNGWISKEGEVLR